MSEADPPGGGDDAGLVARLRVYRGGRARGGRLQPASPRDVARRLSALERRVEKALAGSGGLDPLGADVVQAVTDRALGAFATVRRLTLRDVRAAVESWSALAGALEHDVTESVLDALYRWWWRVEAVGLERVPPRG